MEKQRFAGVSQDSCHRKTPMSESLFSEVGKYILQKISVFLLNTASVWGDLQCQARSI